MAHTCLRVRPIAPPQPEGVRVLVHARDARLSWIESELVNTRSLVQFARTMRDVVAALVDDPPPRPQLLIADFDHIDTAGLLELHMLRDRGWFGTIFGLGDVSLSLSLSRSLGIETIFGPTLRPNTLVSAIASMRSHERQTVRIPRVIVSG